MLNKKNVADLFKSSSAQIGLDDDASDIIIDNLDANTLPMVVGVPVDDLTATSDEVTIIYFALDMSPSMEPVEAELIKEFNETVIAGLRGASKRMVQSFVVGGIAFNESITPLWGGGFKKLEEIPPLDRSVYNTRSGYRTALHKAMLDSLTAVAVYGAQILRETGTPPKVIVPVLSDGANNCPPMSAADVKKVADQLSREMFVLAFAGFETMEPVDFREIARETGFSSIFETKTQAGETMADKQRRLRHLLGTMSSSIIKQSATVVAPSSSQTFWSVVK